MKEPLQKSTLKKLYIGEQKPIRAVAQIVGRSESTVLKYLKKYAIQTRERSQRRGIKHTPDAIRKIKEARAKQIFSDETKALWSKNRKGKPKPWLPGKRKADGGYIQLWIPEHPMAGKNGYILEHRKIMSDVLGRLLSKKEIVHHINGIRDDNRPENLALTTRVKHKDFHTGKVSCPYCQKTYIVKSIGR